jgi:Ser/Thr protein kinase RdoA (MazF antagonist)
MWNVDATIDDEGSGPVAERILDRWAHAPGSLRFFRSSANFIYRFQEQTEPRFLRFVADGDRRRDAIAAEMAIVHSLASAGLDVPAPIPSRQGLDIETVETEWGVFYAVVFTALTGAQLEVVELDAPGFYQWGAALGRLHATMSALPAAPGRPSWTDYLEFIRAYLPDDFAPARTEYDVLLSALTALPISPETYGLIHGDFELDNLIWREGSVGMLDFDDCAYLWYAADIAFALRDILDAGVDMRDERCGAFIEGYRSRRQLSDASLESIPLFSRLSRLFQYARMSRACDLADRVEHPQWLRDLQAKLRQRMADYRASLVAL